jgi:hypothetical protein
LKSVEHRSWDAIANSTDLERGSDPANVHPDPSPPTQPKYESDPQLRKRIRATLGDQRPRKRQEGIWPYLLIRAFPGDHGVRLPPLNNFWESPDILVVKGVVSTLEENTPTLHHHRLGEPRPLQSRFRRLHLPPYTKEQFLNIAIKVCPKVKEETSRIIGEEVWKTSKDVRDVVSLSKLIRKDDGPDEIEAIMRALTKYGSPT